jgi:hypothetical protein
MVLDRFDFLQSYRFDFLQSFFLFDFLDFFSVIHSFAVRIFRNIKN